MTMAGPFSLSGEIYDLLYREKDSAAEAEYIAGLVRNFNPGAVSILDLGCGTGRHARRLMDQGFHVIGVERSRSMADRARAIPGLEVINGDLRAIRLERRFDVVTALFHVVSYVTTIDDLLAMFASVEDHLRPGGLFIFDVWSTPAVLTQHPEVRVRVFRDNEFSVIRTARPVEDPHRSIVTVHLDFRVTNANTAEPELIEERHDMRHFTAGEVELLARSCGLEAIRSEEFLSGAEPSVDTWGVCYVLRKPAA